MGNGTARKKTPAGMVVLQGVLVSLAIYLLAAVVLALLAVKGVMPEESLFPVLAVCCGVCALAGGMTCARRVPWGVLPGADGCCCRIRSGSGGVGLLRWTDGVHLDRRGRILLACVWGAALSGRWAGGGVDAGCRRSSAGNKEEGLSDRLRSGRPSFLFLGLRRQRRQGRGEAGPRSGKRPFAGKSGERGLFFILFYKVYIIQLT